MKLHVAVVVLAIGSLACEPEIIGRDGGSGGGGGGSAVGGSGGGSAGGGSVGGSAGGGSAGGGSAGGGSVGGGSAGGGSAGGGSVGGGSAGGGSAGGGSAGGGSAGGGSAGGGSAGGGSAGSGSAGGGSGSERTIGTVRVENLFGEGTFAAAFGNLSSEQTCSSTIGACTVVTNWNCPNFDGGIIHVTSPGDVGDIVISGTRIDAGTVVIYPSSTPAYYRTFRTVAFNAGDTLTITAPGASIPGFTHTLVAPAPVQITAPTPCANDCIVSAAAGLQVAWTGASSGLVEAHVSVNYGPNYLSGNTSILCRFPAAAGSGLIPAAALQLARPLSSGTVRFRTLQATKSVIGSVEIESVASWPSPASSVRISVR